MRLLATVLFLGLAAIAAGQTILAPPQITTPPRIDGILDETVWKQALVVSDFVQRLPKEGNSPTEKTEVLILYTQTALYLGFRAHDSHVGQIVANVLKRDGDTIDQDDQFAFAIDSYNDGRSGYWFSTNPLGARVDAQFENEGDLWEGDWNSIWDCRSHIDSEGWTAEVEIPFSTLRFKNASSNIMGINFFRRIIRTNEQLFAPLIPLQRASGTPTVSLARKYRFDGIRGGKPWNVKPHALGGLAIESENTDTQTNAGIDFRYQLTSNLTSTFAARMDFAEAEADDRQINLTRFSLFFPEKRDFFLEAANNFLFGLSGDTDIFFSRRIGLTEDATAAVPILFGAKLTGKIQNVDVGVLDVQTQSTSTSEAENFGVVRFRAAVAPQSTVGAIFTRRSGEFASNTYGVDTNLNIAGNIFLNGFAAAISPSAINFRDSSAWYLGLSQGGERTSFLISYKDVGPNFDPAIGFVQRIDSKLFSANLFVPYYTHRNWLLRVTPGYEFSHEDNHFGILTGLFHKVSFKAETPAGDAIQWFGSHAEDFVPESFPVFRDIEIPIGRYVADRMGIVASTAPTRKLSTALTVSDGGFFGGNRLELTPSVLWKMNRHFAFEEDYSSNSIHLPTSDFQIRLTRSRISYSLNTKFTMSGLVQYDNSSQALGVNFRASYLFAEGTELFVVYNEIADEAGLPELNQVSNRSLLVKFTYLIGR